jgi:chemotaxis protein methyltransferase CheR
LNSLLRNTDVAINQDEFKDLQSLLFKLTGILLSENKTGLFSGRLNTRLRALNLASFKSYHQYLSSLSGKSEMDIFVHLMTTHETFFFREQESFNFLKNVILQEKRAEQSNFRLWSAGCSTGEEAYSAAMVIADKFGTSERAPWKVIGTDVSLEVLKNAESAIYKKERLDFMPPQYLKSYCLNGIGQYQGKMLIGKNIRSQTSFSYLNLDADTYQVGQFDVIFLRNTLIYFQPEKKLAIIKKMINALKPMGWLIVGNAESLRGLDSRLKQHTPSIYQLI